MERELTEEEIALILRRALDAAEAWEKAANVDVSGEKKEEKE